MRTVLAAVVGLALVGPAMAGNTVSTMRTWSDQELVAAFGGVLPKGGLTPLERAKLVMTTNLPVTFAQKAEADRTIDSDPTPISAAEMREIQNWVGHAPPAHVWVYRPKTPPTLAVVPSRNAAPMALGLPTTFSLIQKFARPFPQGRRNEAPSI